MRGTPAVKSSDHFYDAVLWAAKKGITSGTDGEHFSPNAPCTREQAVTLLYRASGSPAVSGGSAFSDVAENAYYADAVRWALSEGVTGGIGVGGGTEQQDCTIAGYAASVFEKLTK